MLHFLLSNRSVLVASLLAASSVTGWGAFAYSVSSSGNQLRAVIAERDAAAAKHEQLQAAVADLAQVEAKLFATRRQYTEAVQGWAEVRTKMGAAQQELAALTKRVQQGRDQVSQTSSIRPAEPSKRPAPPR